ncbi:putative secondary metabolism biosynthetic enzyme [Arachnomyces sp. PD_36]|nr:putative secondary metabolism biosynthetic enzyme [Arachnomyces sp. PD_36]
MTKMTKTSDSETDKILDIIAEEVGFSKDELDGNTEFADLGVDFILAKSIVSKIAHETVFRLAENIFREHPTVDSLRSHLQNASKPPVRTTSDENPTPPRTRNQLNPISIILQGKISTAKTIIFLLPDGSGSATAYLRLPAVDPHVCLIGMNSPFLNASKEGRFSVEGIAAIWADEIRRRQPEGPYILGGWSAGGYYAFEAATCLIRRGQVVKKLALIDSPCRLVFEELPMEVVHYLSENNLMGNWGTKQPPQWLIDHFDMSIRAISEYVPTPMEATSIPDVFIIWAKDGVLKNIDATRTGLDLNVKVTQMLLQRPDSDGPLGWDRLFPGAKISLAKMPGNHFTIVHPPDCKLLSLLLKDVQNEESDRLQIYYSFFKSIYLNGSFYSMSESAITKGSTVLVTGANGFIASHVADQILQAGCRVKGTVRSAEKAELISEISEKRHGKDVSSYVVVEDIAAEGALNDAMQAWKTEGFDPATRPFHIYSASKVDSERAAWDFVEKEKPQFVLNTFCPNFNIGGVLDKTQTGSSSGYIRALWEGNPQITAVLQNFPPQFTIDMKDDTRLHLTGLTMEDVKGERLLGLKEPFNYCRWVEILKKIDPSKEFPPAPEGEGGGSSERQI